MFWIDLLKGLGELIAAVAALIAAIQASRAKKDTAATRALLQTMNVTQQQQVVTPVMNVNVNVTPTVGEGRTGTPITFSEEPLPKQIEAAEKDSQKEPGPEAG